ncbi:MAG: hypothetical protein LBK72_02020 [Bifidobacteriaceae bacterium]|nr:hypothetical protein [Bifidobacteriaceae bacterium]
MIDANDGRGDSGASSRGPAGRFGAAKARAGDGAESGLPVVSGSVVSGREVSGRVVSDGVEATPVSRS